MDYGCIDYSGLLMEIESFRQTLSSMGVELKAICFCGSTAAGVMQSQNAVNEYLAVNSPPVVRHVLSHGAINGTEITSPGDEE